jgi:hypothetical protein
LAERAQELTRLIADAQADVRRAARERQQVFVQLRELGWSDVQIGEHCGLTRQAVEAIRKGRGIGG